MASNEHVICNLKAVVLGKDLLALFLRWRNTLITSFLLSNHAQADTNFDFIFYKSSRLTFFAPNDPTLVADFETNIYTQLDWQHHIVHQLGGGS